ncbi:hypothetical protein SLE2022_380230 [Rubroshorea leprosula]
MYALVNQWKGVVKVREEMAEKKVRKVPGCGLIEVDGQVCEFVAGDRFQVHMEEAMLVLLGTDNHLRFAWDDDDNDQFLTIE